jgi:SAM-dependent methyltransferase
MDERKRIVASGYDAIADRFAEWQRGISGRSGLVRVKRLLARLPERPDVLELGIGAGTAPSRLLAERARLTGVDISAEQARRAREALPGATILEADIAEVELSGSSFDAVVALYSLNHLPREELAPLLERVRGWLRPGGLLLATFATGDSAGWRGEWLGTEMYFSG